MQIYEITQGLRPVKEGVIGSTVGGLGSGFLTGLQKAGGTVGAAAGAASEIMGVDTGATGSAQPIEQQSAELAQKMAGPLQQKLEPVFDQAKTDWQAYHKLPFGASVNPAQKQDLRKKLLDIMTKNLGFDYRQLNKMVAQDNETQATATQYVKQTTQAFNQYLDQSTAPTTGAGASDLKTLFQTLALGMAGAISLRQLHPAVSSGGAKTGRIKPVDPTAVRDLENMTGKTDASQMSLADIQAAAQRNPAAVTQAVMKALGVTA